MWYTLPLEIEMHFYTNSSRKYSVFLCFVTGGRYHYRVPSFHFFWEDTTSVRLDVFDSEDTKAVSIFFDIPAHSTSARTTWFGIFDGNCAFVKGCSQNKDFTDISASCAKSMYKARFSFTPLLRNYTPPLRRTATLSSSLTVVLGILSFLLRRSLLVD